MKIFEELKILFGSKFNFYFYLIFFLSIIANIFEVISIGSIGLLIGFTPVGGGPWEADFDPDTRGWAPIIFFAIAGILAIVGCVQFGKIFLG